MWREVGGAGEDARRRVALLPELPHGRFCPAQDGFPFPAEGSEPEPRRRRSIVLSSSGDLHLGAAGEDDLDRDLVQPRIGRAIDPRIVEQDE